jgi:hypothetical protein
MLFPSGPKEHRVLANLAAVHTMSAIDDLLQLFKLATAKLARLTSAAIPPVSATRRHFAFYRPCSHCFASSNENRSV